MKKITTCIIVLVLTSSCVSGINDNQKRRLSSIKYEHPELYQEEKSEGLALALGLLPGGGSFYTRHYAIGASSLILWPYSILWDPINGVNGAKEINYYASINSVKRKKNSELKELNSKYQRGKIDTKKFNIRKMEIEEKYDIDKNL